MESYEAERGGGFISGGLGKGDLETSWEGGPVVGSHGASFECSLGTEGMFLGVAFGAEGYVLAVVVVVHGYDLLESCFFVGVVFPPTEDYLVEVDDVVAFQVVDSAAGQARGRLVSGDPSGV